MLLMMTGGRSHLSSTKEKHTDEGTCKWCKSQGTGSTVCNNCSRSCVWEYRKYKPENLSDNFKISY